MYLDIRIARGSDIINYHGNSSLGYYKLLQTFYQAMPNCISSV